MQLDTGYLALLPALGKGACPWGQKETDLQTWQGEVGWLPGPYPSPESRQAVPWVSPQPCRPQSPPEPCPSRRVTPRGSWMGRDSLFIPL